MENTNAWIPKLQNHQVFSNLRSRLANDSLANLSSSNHKSPSPKNLLANNRGDEILFWDETAWCLYSFNIKAALVKPEDDFVQELVWLNVPKFEIERILLSPYESQLALYGEAGVQIATLPKTRGKNGLYKDGSKSICCQCVTVDEIFFTTTLHKLLSAAWHPGFKSPNVLFVLTSDNSFRIYTSEHASQPVGTINLNTIMADDVVISSKNVLGESFVAFDFGTEDLVGAMRQKKPKTTNGLNNSLVKSSDPNKSAVGSLLKNKKSNILGHDNDLGDDYDDNCHDDDDDDDGVGGAWNIYLLMGNGQVCLCNLVYSHLKFKHTLVGPLRMYPAADDNYGCDACSIIHINSDPPVLVVATCDGKLHHCILLGSSDDDDDDDGDGCDVGGGDDSIIRRGRYKTNGKNSPAKVKTEDGSTKSLYVFETIELELQLSTPSIQSATGDTNSDSKLNHRNGDGGFNGDDDGVCDESIPDLYNLPIMLYKDTSVRERYHCCHVTGLHSIMLPWLQKLGAYFSTDENTKKDDDNDAAAAAATTAATDDGGCLPLKIDDQSIVEHLICTKPLKSCSLVTVMGYTQIHDTFLGSKVICLTSDYNITILPMLQCYKTPTYPLTVEDSAGNLRHSATAAAAAAAYKEDFYDRIQKILNKNTSNPYFRCSLSTTTNAQDCFKILARTTQILREEYIQKINQAKNEIEKHVAKLDKAEYRQKMEIRELLENFIVIKEKRSDLEKKLKRITECKSELNERLKGLSYHIESDLPELSIAEKAMFKKLKSLQERVKKQEFNVTMVERQFEHNKKLMTLPESSPSSSSFASSSFVSSSSFFSSPPHSPLKTSSSSSSSSRPTSSSSTTSSLISSDKEVIIRSMLLKEANEISKLVTDIKRLKNSIGPL